MTNEITRKAIEQFLQRNAAEQKRREAAQEAAGRNFRVHINQITREHREQFEAAQEAQRREEERRAAEAIRKQKREKRETRYCVSWYTFWIRAFVPLILAAIPVNLYSNGALPLWITALAVTILVAICICNMLNPRFLTFGTVKKIWNKCRRNVSGASAPGTNA